MDIVYIEQSLPRHKELSQRVSNITHTKYFGDGNRVWLHGVRTPKDLAGALRAAIRDAEIGDNFIISRDTTFITGDFNPTQAYHSLKSFWLRRKGLEQEAMVNTLRWLMEAGVGTKDYEVPVPRTFSKHLLSKTLEMMEGKPSMLLNTLHFNNYGFVPEPLPESMGDVVLDQWTWNHVPPGPVVTLTETCYMHKDCINWIKSLEQ